MPDQAKRNTLQALTAVATIAAVPGIVQAAIPTTIHQSNIPAVKAHLHAELAAQGLSMDIDAASEFSTLRIRVTNHTDSTVSLDRVSPCLIRADGVQYDINAGLKEQAQLVTANGSCEFTIRAF